MINIKNLQNFIIQIAEEKGLDQEVVAQALADALALAYKKDYAHREDRIEASIHEKTGKVSFFLVKLVVDPSAEEPDFHFNPHRHIALEEARLGQPEIQVGEELEIELTYHDIFSRIAAQTAKQVIVQKLKEVEKEVIYDKFKDREGSIITGTIQKIDPRAIYVDLGRTTGIMFKNEAIPGEILRPQMRLRFYVYAVEITSRGVEVFLSRSHPLFIPAIFRVEVPEISDGVVEVKDVARLPGVRTKMAVTSKIDGVDAVGACIGPRGSRIITIMNELHNEKIDIIPWDDDAIKYVINALLPAKVNEAHIIEKHTIKALVSEDQVPVALGRSGQNIKLASRLTGWRIDVRVANQPETELEGGVASEGPVSSETEGAVDDQEPAVGDQSRPVKVELHETESRELTLTKTEVMESVAEEVAKPVEN